jgi:hypothetical protein
MWEWCLKESIPSNAFLVANANDLTHVRGESDGNVGDWGIFGPSYQQRCLGTFSLARRYRFTGCRPGLSLV